MFGIRLKFYFLFIVSLVSILTCNYILEYLYSYWMEKRFYDDFYNENNNSSSNLTDNECKVPFYSPFDATIRKYIKKLSPLKCKETQPQLLKFYNDTLWFDRDVLKELGTLPEDYKCHYFEIFRRNDLSQRDKHVDIGRGIHFDRPVLIDKDYIRVNCSMGFYRQVYASTLLKVTPPSKELLQRVLPSSGKHPSVFIVGFDSTSRLNFIRQMKKTSNFMEKTLKGVYLKGLNQIGRNTRPNMGTFMTGRYVYHSGAIKAPTLKDISNISKFWDDFPLVWKNFSRSGYVTMITEDANPTTFNHLSLGFKDVPTDYYNRPFFLAMETLFEYKVKFHCFDGIPKHKYFLPYIQDFVSKFKGKSHFSFNFITDYSHDYINNLQYLDEDVWQMLSKLHKSGALENTIVILLGDHGNRYDYIRQTVVGRFEERMPLFIISLPESLKKEYPHLQKGLESNSETLLSFFDMYELLMDVASGNLEEKSKVERYGMLGLSPFRRIPKTRTCHEIGIPQEYCICNEESKANLSDSKVILSAVTLVNHVNFLLPPVCMPLELREIVDAHVVKPNSGFAIPHGLSIIHRLIIVVNPSKAVLEGIVLNTAWSREVIGDVGRINSYGNQSYCVSNEVLKLYCYCF